MSMRTIGFNRFFDRRRIINVNLFPIILVFLLSFGRSDAGSNFHHGKRRVDIRFHVEKNRTTTALRKRRGGIISSLWSVSNNDSSGFVLAKQHEQENIGLLSREVKNWECFRGGGRGDRTPWRVPSSPAQSFGQSSSSSTQTYPVVEDVTEEERQKSVTDAKETVSAFLSRDNRNSFIVRVYSILSVQLVFTCAVIGLFQRIPALSHWMLYKGRAVPMLSLIVSSITCIIMASSVKARQSSPLKWQLLSLFTLCESIAVGFISSFYSGKTVLNALLSTAVATLTVTFYTLFNPNPKYDLSQWGSGLLSAGIILIVYGIIGLLSQTGVLPIGFLPYNEAIYSLLGVTLFSLYLAYHTRLIISGKHTKYQLNEKDYVFGAMSLYNDIIDIFIFLLRLLDEDR